jgi:ATP-dependent DNA helicase RecG
LAKFQQRTKPLRPADLNSLFRPITSLAGVGPRLSDLVERISGPLVRDLLFTRPHRVVERIATSQIRSLREGEVITAKIVIESHLAPTQPRKPYRVRARAEDAFLTLVWFHAREAQMRKLAPQGAQMVVSGKLERFGAEYQIAHPDYLLPLARADELPAIEPVYPLTAGLSNKVICKAMSSALADLPALPEWLDPHLIAREGWPDWRTAIQTVHLRNKHKLVPAVSRLSYDEMLADQLTLVIARTRLRRRASAPLGSARGDLVARLIETAPFRPTQAQRRASREIIDDLESPHQMSRLLQGDVGAGKTFVAALAAARVASGEQQTAIMAPTEVLARQHARTLTELLAPLDLRVAALTGRDKGSARASIVSDIASGSVDVVCGTHALFQESVSFSSLRLVVVDEQHRFGVQERMRLLSKAEQPDLLVMTATPIPRTLTLAQFGDMEVSRLDEKPAGRKPIETRVVPHRRLGDVVEAIRRATGRGEQVYWVCPLVEDSEHLDVTSVEERATSLRAVLPDLNIALLHGRLKGEEKEALVQSFREGEAQLLVATTVIEVGVDAPDATLIVIENAERFGLSQLHQLRGRVGRSDKPSSCILMYKAPLGEVAQRRLEAIRASEDGFFLAEEDWKLRGSGDVLGTRQTGDIAYRFADLARDGDLLAMASQDARLIIEQDATLTTSRGEALRKLLYLFNRDQAIRLLKIG